MFIRETKTKNKKTGKIYSKHSLVESVRTPKGPRQRTIMQLGRLDIPRSSWPTLVAELERRISHQQELPFDDIDIDSSVRETADNVMQNYGIREKRRHTHIKQAEKADYRNVDLNTVSNSYSRSVGPELVADRVWKDLSLPGILEKLGFDARERSLAEAVIAARLINPGSEKKTWEWIRRSSAIGELTEKNLLKTGRNSVYEIADRLFDFKANIENELFRKEQELYPERESVYLFDITNFYLEGQALDNSLAAYGKSKQKRNDCPLISLGMVVDSKGFPVLSRIYEGNIGEPSTLEDILGAMRFFDSKQQVFKFASPSIIMDRGIATKDNINMLREMDIPYTVIERGARNKDHLDAFKNYKNDDSFTLIERKNNPRKVWVKKVADEGDTVQILCISEKKRIKEKKMSERWQERASEDIIKLQNSVRNGYVKVPDKIHKRIGRLYERYPGFGKHFDVKLITSDDGETGVDINFRKKAVLSDDKEENPLWGTYVIEISHKDKSASEIWYLYMTLTRMSRKAPSIIPLDRPRNPA